MYAHVWKPKVLRSLSALSLRCGIYQAWTSLIQQDDVASQPPGSSRLPLQHLGYSHASPQLGASNSTQLLMFVQPRLSPLEPFLSSHNATLATKALTHELLGDSHIQTIVKGDLIESTDQ